MMVLGIDPGLRNTGWALVGPAGDLDSYEHVETGRRPERGDAQRRLALVLKAAVIAMRKASAVVVEWPSAGGFVPVSGNATGNAAAAAQTNMVAGALVGLAVGLGGARRVVTPSPVTWRSRLGAKRGADHAIHAALLTRYPQLRDLRMKAQPHVLDAVGLALFGRLVLNLDRKETST